MRRIPHPPSPPDDLLTPKLDPGPIRRDTPHAQPTIRHSFAQSLSHLTSVTSKTQRVNEGRGVDQTP